MNAITAIARSAIITFFAIIVIIAIIATVFIVLLRPDSLNVA